jgi:hypothetical protein
MDRNLKYFLTALIILGGLAVGAFFIKARQTDYLSDNTPEAVVHNYLLAVQRKDAAMLQRLLLPTEDTPSASDVAAALAGGEVSLADISVQILDAQLLGDQALVTLKFWANNGLFDGGYSYQEIARLQQVDGRWYVTQMPYPIWSWNWGQEGVLKR